MRGGRRGREGDEMTHVDELVGIFKIFPECNEWYYFPICCDFSCPLGVSVDERHQYVV